MQEVYETYLVHHGIKGQKWGVRRYRNEDGSLTPAGQKRYKKNDEIRKKEIDRYSRMEKYERNDLERQKRNVQKLYRQGPNGKYMNQMYGNEMSYYESLGYTRKGLFEEELSNWNHDANISAERAEAFTNAQKALMEMDVSTCKKSDIYKRGKRAVIDTYNAQSDNEDKKYY